MQHSHGPVKGNPYRFGRNNRCYIERENRLLEYRKEEILFHWQRPVIELRLEYVLSHVSIFWERSRVNFDINLILDTCSLLLFSWPSFDTATSLTFGAVIWPAEIIVHVNQMLQRGNWVLLRCLAAQPKEKHLFQNKSFDKNSILQLYHMSGEKKQFLVHQILFSILLLCEVFIYLSRL